MIPNFYKLAKILILNIFDFPFGLWEYMYCKKRIFDTITNCYKNIGWRNSVFVSHSIYNSVGRYLKSKNIKRANCLINLDDNANQYQTTWLYYTFLSPSYYSYYNMFSVLCELIIKWGVHLNDNLFCPCFFSFQFWVNFSVL